MKFKRDENAIKKIQTNAERALERTALKYQSILRNEAPKDLGTTAQTIHAEKVTDSKWMIGSSSASANVREVGRRAGSKMPPMDALIGWVSRKAGLTGNRTQTYSGAKGKGATTLKSLTFLIARSIGKRGIKPRHFFSKSWEKHKDYIIQYFYSVMKQS